MKSWYDVGQELLAPHNIMKESTKLQKLMNVDLKTRFIYLCSLQSSKYGTMTKAMQSTTNAIFLP